jgi:CBS domain-containing protein
MNVADIMTSPVATVEPATPVGAVARIMLERSLSGLPVVDQSGKLVGLVTESDLVAKHAHVHVPRYLGILGGVFPLELHNADEEMRRVLAVTAGDLMTRDVIVIAPEATVEDAATLMVEEHANPIPVVANHRPVGIVSRADVVRLLVLEENGAGPTSSSF